MKSPPLKLKSPLLEFASVRRLMSQRSTAEPLVKLLAPALQLSGSYNLTDDPAETSIPTMDVVVSYLGLVRNVTGRGEERVRVEPETTVRDLLDLLTARHGEAFRHSLFRHEGELRSFTQVCVDDRDIEELQGLDTKVSSGKTVSIVLGVYAPVGG